MEVPRKNGKTELGAGVADYMLVADNEPGAEVYSTATKEAQAKIVWSAAREMVKQSPDLRRFVKIRRNSLSCDQLGSFFQPLGSDSKTQDGLNPHAHVCDELHAHKNRGMWDVMITAMGARRQPLTFAITTAGTYDPESIGWELHDYSTKILEGAIEDDSCFAIIFAMDEGDDWQLPATWAKANPNFGISVKEDSFATQCEMAKRQPSFLNAFLRLHLDRWTEQQERWLSLERWNQCPSHPIVLEDLRGRRAFGGLDLSTRLDMTSFSLVVPADDGYFDFFWRMWVPQTLIEERARDHRMPDYSAWERDGWLFKTPGNVIDYDFIRREINEISHIARLEQIGYDPYNATQLALNLQSDGITMVEMRQGLLTLSDPSKEFEKLIVAGRIRHGGNPIMKWMVANTAKREDANGNIAPDKRTSGGKIDGVSAAINALGRAIASPVFASVYETRGVRTV